MCVCVRGHVCTCVLGTVNIFDMVMCACAVRVSCLCVCVFMCVVYVDVCKSIYTY